jgi:hypothetical protein
MIVVTYLFEVGEAFATMARRMAEDTGAPPPIALSNGETITTSIAKVFQKKASALVSTSQE